MQIEAHILYPTMFLIGHRMAGGVPERVGTVVVKGTFQDMDAPVAVCKDRQIPVFVKDLPFNVVFNSSFEGEDKDGNDVIDPWLATDGTVVQEAAADHKWARLTSDGDADQLVQTLEFDGPVGGRTFILSFDAWADAPTTVSGFQLRIPETTTSICNVTASLTTLSQRFVSPAESWLADEGSTQVEVVLVGSGDSLNSVYFDNVQVEEATVLTRWNSETVFRYEHDLAAYKPQADVIVLGAAEPPDSNYADTWHVVMDTSSGLSIEKEFGSLSSTFHTKTVFGWASRSEDPRLAQAGSNLQNFDPANLLPDDFDNQFYNGYDRLLSGDVPLNYLADGTTLTFRSERRPVLSPGDERELFEAVIVGSRPIATLTVLDGSGQEQDLDVPIVLDTVVLEPDADTYVLVWRGVWRFDDHAEENYIRLVVTGGL